MADEIRFGKIIKDGIDIITGSDGQRMNELLAPEFISADDEAREFVLAFKIRKWMENPRGQLHGGAAGAMFDISGGLATLPFSIGGDRATIDLYVNYIAMVEGSDTVFVKVKVLSKTRRFIRLYMEATSKDTGKLAATANATYALLAENRRCGGGTDTLELEKKYGKTIKDGVLL